jgi:hypothetical protein
MSVRVTGGHAYSVCVVIEAGNVVMGEVESMALPVNVVAVVIVGAGNVIVGGRVFVMLVLD